MNIFRHLLDAITVEAWELVARAIITMVVLFTYGKSVLDAGETLGPYYVYLMTPILVLWTLTPQLKKVQQYLREKDTDEAIREALEVKHVGK